MAKTKQTTADLIDASDGAIIRAAHLAAPVVGWVEIPPLGTPLDKLAASMDLTDPCWQVVAFNAMNAGDLVFDSKGECRVDIQDWMVYADEGENEETGEVGQFERVVLIDPQLRTFRTTSPVVKDALDRLIRFKRSTRFSPAVPVVIRERRSHKTGRTYHEMRLLMVGETVES